MRGLIVGFVSIFVVIVLFATMIIPAVENTYEKETQENPDPTLSLGKYYRTIFFDTELDLEITDAGDDQITVKSGTDTQTADFGPMIITAADNSSIFIDDYDHIICTWYEAGSMDYQFLELPITAVTSGDDIAIDSNGNTFTIPKPVEWLYKPISSGEYGSYDHGDLWTSMHIAAGYFAEPAYNGTTYSGLLNEHITESDGKLQSITWDNTTVPEDNNLQGRIILPEPQLTLPEQNINILGVVPTPTYTDGDWGYNLADDKATIVSYSGSAGNITVPATVGGYDVVALGLGTSNNTVFDPDVILNSTLTIPGSIKTINNYAFKGCTGLTAVTLNEGIESIGNYSFHSCSGLSSVTIPSSVISIGDGAFFSCSNLVSVTLNEGLVSINQYCFMNCTSLASFTTPSTVTTIGYNCFKGCTGLTAVTLNEGLTTLRGAFINCSNLTSINVPTTVTDLNSAFQNCTSLSSISVTGAVSNYQLTFDGCTGLISATINANGALTNNISQQIFRGCSSLADVTIMDGVNMLGSYAFSNCTALKSITIPSGVKTIGDYVFNGCTSLQHIRLSEGLDTISRYVFQGCSSIKSITIPSSVTSIGANALRSAAIEQILNLSSLTITTSMTGSPLPAIDDHIDAAAYIAMKEPTILVPDSQYNGMLAVIPIAIALVILAAAAFMIMSKRD